MTSILPPNATRLERAIERSALVRPTPQVVRDLFDPDRCPIEHLPWLAWNLGIDTWSNDWPENVRRERVRRAIEIQRKKGTIGAVRAAVRSFGGQIAIREWWEETPRAEPHTFQLLLTLNEINGAAPPAEYIEAVIDEVTLTKPLRSHFIFTLGLSIVGNIGQKAVARPLIYTRLDCVAAGGSTAAAAQILPGMVQRALARGINAGRVSQILPGLVQSMRPPPPVAANVVSFLPALSQNAAGHQVHSAVVSALLPGLVQRIEAALTPPEITLDLEGHAIGAGVALGTLSVTIELTGEAMGTGVASGAITPVAELAGQAIGRGEASGAITIGNTRLLEGAAIGRGVATGNLALGRSMLVNGTWDDAGAWDDNAPWYDGPILLAGAAIGRGVATGALTTVGAGGSFDADALAYFSAMTTQPDDTRKGLINDLITGVKAVGYWSILDWLVFYASHDQQASLINARMPSKKVTMFGNMIFTVDRGWTGAGGYGDIGEVANASGNNYALNSASKGAYCNLSAGTNGVSHFGVATDTTARIIATSGAETFSLNDSATGDSLRPGSGTAATARLGHRYMSRQASNDKRGFFNGAKVAARASASTAVSAGNPRSHYSNGTLSNDRVACIWLGGGLTDEQANDLHNRIHTYLTAIGANY